MPSNFTPVQVNPELKCRIEESINAFNEDSERLLTFLPPENHKGQSRMKELFRTIHKYEAKDSFLKHKNQSPVIGLEYWYEKGEFNYVFYSPSEEIEKILRKQLFTHYDGSDIQLRTPYMFDIEEDEYVVGCRFKLKNHYFEPIKSFDGPGRFEINPFHSIFGELDTQDDLRVIIQFLFKPAENDWTHLHTKNVEEYADMKREETRTSSKFFGLKTKEIEPSSEQKQAASAIEDQVGKLGYYVNMRLFMVSKNKQELKSVSKEVAHLFNIEFESALGQTLEPMNHTTEEDVTEQLINTILRKPEKMYQPKTPVEYVKSTRMSGSDILIMNIPELATLAHIPTRKELPIESINWTDTPIGGRMPADTEFTELTDEEKEQVSESRKQSSELYNEEDSQEEPETPQRENPEDQVEEMLNETESDADTSKEENATAEQEVDDLLDSNTDSESKETQNSDDEQETEDGESNVQQETTSTEKDRTDIEEDVTDLIEQETSPPEESNETSEDTQEESANTTSEEEKDEDTKKDSKDTDEDKEFKSNIDDIIDF